MDGRKAEKEIIKKLQARQKLVVVGGELLNNTILCAHITSQYANIYNDSSLRCV